MDVDARPSDRVNDRVELRELWLALLRGKWLIIATTFVFTAAAVTYALLQPNVFESEVLLAPATSEEGDGLAGLAGQLGGLASLAGISLGSSSTDKTTLALEVLQSRAFITGFVKRREILPYLMAAESWNRNTGEWVIDPDLYDVVQRKWVRVVDPPRKPEPSNWEVFKVFRKDVLGVSRDDETGMVRVSVRSLSPVAAQRWLTWLIEDLNHHMRVMDVTNAEKSIQYLKAQIEETSVAEMQNVFYDLIEQQTRTVMLANVRDDYIFNTVDPPVAPEEKVKPMRALICVLGFLVGAMFGGVFVLFRHFAGQSGASKS